MFSLKSGVQFSMTSKITRQMIHLARNSAGVLLCASQRTIHGSFQAVTFSVWQEQERKIRAQVSSHGCVTHYSIRFYLENVYQITHSARLSDCGLWWEWEWRRTKEKGIKKGETITALKEFMAWLEKPGFPSWNHHSSTKQCTVVQTPKQGHRR